MKLLSHKKGNIIDIVLSPLFVTVVALGIVLVILLSAINQIGTSTEFKKQRDATDLGLLIDSVYAVRPDVNVRADYVPTDSKFGFDIEGTKVTVYDDKVEDGKYFWFAQVPKYEFTGGNFPKGSKILSFYKIGNRAGVINEKAKLIMVKPFCDAQLSKKYAVKVETAALNDLTQRVDVISGEMTVKAQLKTGPGVIKIFVNKNPDSAQVACLLLENLVEKIPGIQGFAIVPFSSVVMQNTDPMKAIAVSSLPGAFVELTLPVTDSRLKSQLFDSFFAGVSYVG